MRSNTPIIALALAAAASATTIPITVGKGGLVFSPSSVTAAVGDILEFEFYPGDHSVAQGTFAAPCSQGTLTTGFYSGFMQVATGPGSQVFQVTVKDTNPIWFYCSQVEHCQSGMAGVVNPPASGDTLAAYISAAALTSESQSPPAVQGGVVGAAGAAASSATSSVEISSTMSQNSLASMTSEESSLASESAMSSTAMATTTADTASSSVVTTGMASMTNVASMTDMSTMATSTGPVTPSTTSPAPAAQSTNGAPSVGIFGTFEMLGLTGAVAVMAAFMV